MYYNGSNPAEVVRLTKQWEEMVNPKKETDIMEPLYKKEIREQLEEIERIVENDVHHAVSPGSWWVYSNLHDEIKQLELLLERNGAI